MLYLHSNLGPSSTIHYVIYAMATITAAYFALSYVPNIYTDGGLAEGR